VTRPVDFEPLEPPFGVTRPETSFVLLAMTRE
jgi:hypothetical protein